MSFNGLPSPVPRAPGPRWAAASGSACPSKTSRSRRHTCRQISTTSRVRPSGASNGTPWKPSITCGPDVPMPEPEPAVGDVVQPGGRHRHQRGRAGVDRHDAGAEFDPRGPGRQEAQLADRVEGVGLGDQRDVDADLLQFDDLVDRLEEAARVAEENARPHRLLHGPGIHPTGWLGSRAQGFSSATTLFSRSTGSSANGSIDRRLGQLELGVGEVAVGLVAGQHVQQVSGHQRPHHLLGAAVRAGQSERTAQPAALDQSARLGLRGGPQRRPTSTPGPARRRWSAASSGSPGAVRISPGTDSVAAGCSARGSVTVGNRRRTPPSAWPACRRRRTPPPTPRSRGPRAPACRGAR